MFIVQEQMLLGDDELMIKYYQQYIDIVKGPEEMAKATVKGKLIEAYNTMAAGYANTEMKAIELFNKTLAIDPENGYAKQSVEMLKDKNNNICAVMKTDS
jgi:hypothetical protein